jgi:hypothetical protein
MLSLTSRLITCFCNPGLVLQAPDPIFQFAHCNNRHHGPGHPGHGDSYPGVEFSPVDIGQSLAEGAKYGRQALRPKLLSSDSYRAVLAARCSGRPTPRCHSRRMAEAITIRQGLDPAGLAVLLFTQAQTLGNCCHSLAKLLGELLPFGLILMPNACQPPPWLSSSPSPNSGTV